MLPSALEHVEEIVGASGRVAVFLDYDGTLTPIVSHPQDAWLSDSMREALHRLAAGTQVAILSGRDLRSILSSFICVCLDAKKGASPTTTFIHSMHRGPRQGSRVRVDFGENGLRRH